MRDREPSGGGVLAFGRHIGLMALATAVAIVMSACTGANAPIATPTPSEAMEASPTAAGRVVVDALPPNKASAATVLLDVPSLIIDPGVDSELIAPESFIVDGERIILTDLAHNRISTYEGNHLVGSVPIPEELLGPVGNGIYDLAITGDRYWFLDDDNRVLEYQLNNSGNRLEWVKTKNTNLNDAPGQLVTQGESVVLISADHNVLVSGPGPAPASLTYTVSKKERLLHVHDGNLRIDIHVPYPNSFMGLVAREPGLNYYLVSSGHYTKKGWIYYQYVYQFTNTGQLLHTYTLRLNWGHQPSQTVRVYDGNIYQLQVPPTTARVLQLHPNP
ncbi:hypothetical protein [Propionicimonas sp.]|uniref:hypothetical protein n=1 Tax=Propionicimonas sp. TaxID=1955623 RepID=UPI0039E29EBD